MAATLVGLANGFRRGFWLSLTQYLGLLAGVLLGAIAAQPVLDYIKVTSPRRAPSWSGACADNWRQPRLEHRIRDRRTGSTPGILRSGVHSTTDSLAGAALSTLAVLMMMWFLGLSFSRRPSQEVAQQIQKSVVLRKLDSIAPRPPDFLARVQGILAGVSFPTVFAGLVDAARRPSPSRLQLTRHRWRPRRSPWSKLRVSVAVASSPAAVSRLVADTSPPMRTSSPEPIGIACSRPPATISRQLSSTSIPRGTLRS